MLFLTFSGMGLYPTYGPRVPPHPENRLGSLCGNMLIVSKTPHGMIPVRATSSLHPYATFHTGDLEDLVITGESIALKLTVHFRCFSGRTICLSCLHDIDRAQAAVPGALCDPCEGLVNDEVFLVSPDTFMAQVRVLLAKKVTSRSPSTSRGPVSHYSWTSFRCHQISALMERCSEAGRNSKLPP